MYRFFPCLVLLFLTNQIICNSQQSDFIQGKITDSKTRQPLSYATVRLKNNQTGVFTNAEGDFRVLNKPAFQSDSLVVTCIGYYRLSIAFSDLKTSEINNLKLSPVTYGLNEVKVSARKRRLNSAAIVDRAIQNIKKNYPAGPFSYVSYYRDYQKDSSGYLNLNEAIIQTLDTGFTCKSETNRYRLLEFRQNMDFPRMDITPYYDLPETDHSDIWFKRIPYAKVGDQYGNELFILLVHDAIRNFNTRSFSFIDTLNLDFIDHHIFSTPVGMSDGNTVLYKISFTARRQVTGKVIQVNGAIFIQPDDYSIHRLEYSASFLDSAQKKKEIFNIEIEYGHEASVDSRMCLKYISFNNSFTVPDASDTNYFKIEKTEWMKAGGPYTRLWNEMRPNMTIYTVFNRKIDSVSAGKMENYSFTLGDKKAKIEHIKVEGDTLYLTIRDDKFSNNEIYSSQLNIKNLKDLDGNILNKRRDLELRQFRELFVQEYNKPLEFIDECFIQLVPLEQSCISHSKYSDRFWMNTPLKGIENLKDLRFPGL